MVVFPGALPAVLRLAVLNEGHRLPQGPHGGGVQLHPPDGAYSPGGFCPGAGHGSTLEDRHGNWWHTSTMRISVNHDFERRGGLWPAGVDAHGGLAHHQVVGQVGVRLPLVLQYDPALPVGAGLQQPAGKKFPLLNTRWRSGP